MKKILPIGSASRRMRRGLVLAAMAGVFAVAGISAASAQATQGSIFGKAPAGDTVSVHSISTGAGRTVHVDSEGRYLASHLPVGIYTVTLKKDDKAYVEHPNVAVSVARGQEVDFDCSKIECGAAAN